MFLMEGSVPRPRTKPKLRRLRAERRARERELCLSLGSGYRSPARRMSDCARPPRETSLHREYSALIPSRCPAGEAAPGDRPAPGSSEPPGEAWPLPWPLRRTQRLRGPCCSRPGSTAGLRRCPSGWPGPTSYFFYYFSASFHFSFYPGAAQMHF